MLDHVRPKGLIICGFRICLNAIPRVDLAETEVGEGVAFAAGTKPLAKLALAFAFARN